MSKDKDLKRLIRSRMQKTGESYTTARVRVLAKAPARKSSRQTTQADLSTKAGMSDEAVRKATGRDWQRWVEALDGIDASTLTHRDIARHIHDTWKLSSWWTQTVTVGYERIKGLREIGQRRSGTYEINKSKTIAVPIALLYRAFSVARTRQRWLPGVELEVRKRTPEKSMRVTWQDDTPVEISFSSKSEAKSQVTIQHRMLASKSDAEIMRQYWGERLADLAGLLTDSAS